VRSADYMVEALLPGFYLPGYGLRGVPLYLIGNSEGYRRHVYSEPELGINDTFHNVMENLEKGEVAVSPGVAETWHLNHGTPVLLGSDQGTNAIFASTAGIVAFLPGIPPRTVADRQGFVQAKIDYLNYLFSTNAYLIAAAD